MPDTEQVNTGVIENQLKMAGKTAALCGAKGGAIEILYKQGKIPELLDDLGKLNKNGNFVSYLYESGVQISYWHFVYVVAGAIETFMLNDIDSRKNPQYNWEPLAKIRARALALRTSAEAKMR